MAVAGAPWQLEFENVEQRCAYLLTSGRWADCTFMVGSGTDGEVIQAHKLVLAMASSVFEAMFYGALSERNDPIVSIPDVEPEAFRALLQYIYTGNIDISSFDLACDLWYAAKKYMLPHLAKQCISYISPVVGPRNACRAYELACLFEEKTIMDKCIQIISTNTKEVLNDSSFVDVELKTLITVCSLEHLTVDSELELFHAVARYAEEQRRQGQISPPVEGGPSSEELSEKELFPSVASSSKTSPAAELDSQPPPEVGTSEPTADKQNVKEEPSIRAALQKLRFLSLTAAQFAEGPACSALLTKDESFAPVLNIASRDSPVPMPPGFSECRERRQPQNAQCFEAGSLDHTINALKCGDPSQVERAAWAAVDIMWNSAPLDIQAALNKGMLDALVPALTEGSDKSKEHAAYAIYRLCDRGSPAQLRVLAEGAALQPYCHLLATTWGDTCVYVVLGLTELLKRVEQNIKPGLLQKLRALGVPKLLMYAQLPKNGVASVFLLLLQSDTMAVAGAPWQLECEKVEQRCAYLLTSGQWSDCSLMVGSGTNQEVIPAHKLVLAMASPVFEAMFYGALSERNDPIVSIPDVEPEAFRALLQYVYTGNIDISSFDLACDLWYAAKKYMLPHLEKQCSSYICSAVGPRNVFRAYELAHLFEEETVVDKCIQVISTNTKEVLNDSSLVDVELKTLIKVCSLEHLTVDSELDLFHAVARYAEEQRRQGQISPPVEGGPSSEELSEKELFPSVGSSSKTSPEAELDSKAPPEVVTAEPTADKQNVKEEEPSIRAALQKLRFLSLTAAQFAEGPARSALLTKDESFAVLMNIASRDSPVPMPPGFSECRERRQPRTNPPKNAQCFRAGSLDHTINALKCGDPSQVERAARAAADMLYNNGASLNIQPALDKGILDALVPALTEGSDKSKEHAARAIHCLCARGSSAQLRVLAEGAALQPYCRLLAATWGHTCVNVLIGLTLLLQRVEQNIKPGLLQKLRALGVPQLLIPLKQHLDPRNRSQADNLLRTYFTNDQ